MKIQHQGHYYTPLPMGERINISHYFLEDDMRVIPAPSHMIGTKVQPWDVGLWFTADKSPTLYVKPSGSISNTPPPGTPLTSGLVQVVPQTDKALTYDDGKAPLAHLPWDGVDAVAMVQAYGHKKYKDFYNYRKGMELGRNASCAIRHIRDFMKGHDNDAESGQSHLAHAACRLLFMIQNLADGTAIDERYSKRRKEAA